MIKTVILFSNGLTIVFDGHGQQIPEYQGHIVDDADRIDSLTANVSNATEYRLGQDLRSPVPISGLDEFKATVEVWRERDLHSNQILTNF